MALPLMDKVIQRTTILVVWLFAASIFTYCLPSSAHAETRNIALVTHGDNQSYSELLQAFTESFGTTGQSKSQLINISSLREKEFNDKITNSTLLIPIGTKATEKVINFTSNKQIFSVLVPKLTIEQLDKSATEKNSKLSALFLDQPVIRQLRLIQAIFPGNPVIGVITGHSTAAFKNEFLAAGQSITAKIQFQHILDSNDLYKRLPHVLESAKVLLPMADPDIYNPRTIEYLFLSAYRKQVPIIGFSDATVRAGALAAVFSTPVQLGHQLAISVKRWLNGSADALNDSYPNEFTVTINRQVARSLDIKIMSEESLVLKIKQFSGDKK